MRNDIPAPYRPYLRIGTCSWKYDSWKGLYYDAGRRYHADDYLADYARYLDSVEVDQWFWSLFPGGVRLPEPRTVSTYATSVPDDFKFTIKAPNALTLTHFYARQPRHHVEFAGRPNIYFLDNELLERFLGLLAPLGDKIGPIMFQFEYLSRSKMPSCKVFLERFGEFITKAPPGFDYAIEVGPDDEAFESNDIKVVVRRLDLAFLDGSTLDFERSGLNDIFKVDNPKAIATCGCGESFTVDSASSNVSEETV